MTRIRLPTSARSPLVTGRSRTSRSRSDLGLWTIGVDGGMDNGQHIRQVGFDVPDRRASTTSSFTDYASGMGNSGDFACERLFPPFRRGDEIRQQQGHLYLLVFLWRRRSGRRGTSTPSFQPMWISTPVSPSWKEATRDDDYFTERPPTIMDKGFMMNKLALDSKLSDKMTVGRAALFVYDDRGGHRVL